MVLHNLHATNNAPKIYESRCGNTVAEGIEPTILWLPRSFYNVLVSPLRLPQKASSSFFPFHLALSLMAKIDN